MRSLDAVTLPSINRPDDAAGAADRVRTRPCALSQVSRPRSTTLGLSLTLHGVILLSLLTTYPVLRPRSPEVSYDVIVVPDVAQPAPAAEESQPTEPQKQVSAAPEPAGPPVPQPAPTQALAPPPAEPLRAPPLAEPPPAPPPAPAVEQAKPVVRPRPHAVAAAPRPHKREVTPMEAARRPVASPTPSATPAPPVAAVPPPQSAGPDPVWLARVSEWLMTHQSYPESARRRGEQGTVVVRFEADRSGQVLNASLVRGSGLALLDQAALAQLSGARLPPFPPDMPGARETVTVPVRYRLE